MVVRSFENIQLIFSSMQLSFRTVLFIFLGPALLNLQNCFLSSSVSQFKWQDLGPRSYDWYAVLRFFFAICCNFSGKNVKI